MFKAASCFLLLNQCLNSNVMDTKYEFEHKTQAAYYYLLIFPLDE